jgi:hypothetical protein
MASFLSRFRRPETAPAAAPPETAPVAGRPRRPLPPVGQIRRERRALLRVREERIRDLGGLVLEMVRRDAFGEDLVLEQTTELMSIDERLYELDTLLATAAVARRTPPAARCECGAPILWGSHFCANCGRTVDGTAPGAERAPEEAPVAEAAPAEPAAARDSWET